ncbi:hypothetical protein KJ980_05500 [Patescibacteria group bacterium]|nr:hypothetical protein [Patescibacteria group bacterium]MBU4099076.1 hypothetical protein [Patescibacteria group bacterium]
MLVQIPAIMYSSKTAIINRNWIKNGYLIISHDLHNHNGELPDGVAEKFIAWAKGEKLSFWR